MASFMQKEIQSIPSVIDNQLKENQQLINQVSAKLSHEMPSMVYTVGRGTSSCVGTFIKYAISCFLGCPVASFNPSIASLYQAPMRLDSTWFIVISQSGESPDLCKTISIAKDSGAQTIALVNQVDSPLADLADMVIPLLAGKEYSVAATKTFVASLTAFLHLLSAIAKDSVLKQSLIQLPLYLDQAASLQWPSATSVLISASQAVILARGYGLAIAQESALKLKETSLLHAEAFSSASFKHGPMALIANKIPIMAYVQDDVTADSVFSAIDYFHQIGSPMHLALPLSLRDRCPTNLVEKALLLPEALHPCLDPIIAIQAFYVMAEYLSVCRGCNPDKPNFLNKITKTY